MHRPTRAIAARRCSSPAPTSNYIQPEHRPAIRALFPNARFVTLKNAGHWLHADNPAGFVAVVEAFLTAHGLTSRIITPCV